MKSYAVITNLLSLIGLERAGFKEKYHEAIDYAAVGLRVRADEVYVGTTAKGYRSYLQGDQYWAHPLTGARIALIRKGAGPEDVAAARQIDRYIDVA